MGTAGHARLASRHVSDRADLEAEGAESAKQATQAGPSLAERRIMYLSQTLLATSRLELRLRAGPDS